MTVILLIALALVLCGFVALPLLFPNQSDPLPDYADPVLKELQEERDALFRAIREVEGRTDLADARRSELRARYEAKAAGVLRAIDERENELTSARESAPAPASTRSRRFPYAGVAMVALLGVTAASLSEFVFPRVNESQTVTTFFEDDLAASQELRDLRRAAERDPSTANLLALADAYWRLQDAEQAEETYRRVLTVAEPVPAIAYRRLGFLTLQDDLAAGAELLEQAEEMEPGDAQTLFTLGEVYLVESEFDDAREAFTAYLETTEGAGDETAEARLDMIETVAPLAQAARANPSEENLLALADAYWVRGEQQRAVNVYFRVLTEVSPNSIPALTRTGEVLFLSGRPSDAIQLFERARSVAESQGQTIDARSLLLLGNAHFAEDAYAEAIDAWEQHLVVADEPGRVPDLIASARARLEGNAGGSANEQAGSTSPDGSEQAVDTTVADAQQLYQANCATCHGASGQGGFGPALVGNPRAQNEGNVASIVRFGRGSMPGFGAVLSEEELLLIVDYVIEDLSRTASNAP